MKGPDQTAADLRLENQRLASTCKQLRDTAKRISDEREKERAKAWEDHQKRGREINSLKTEKSILELKLQFLQDQALHTQQHINEVQKLAMLPGDYENELKAEIKGLHDERSQYSRQRWEVFELQTERDQLKQQAEANLQEYEQTKAQLDQLKSSTSANLEASESKVAFLNEQIDKLQVAVDEGIEAKVRSSHAVVRLISDILRMTVYGDTTRWKLEDMKPLELRFNVVRYERNLNPPAGFVLCGREQDSRNTAHFTSASALPCDELNSDFGGLLYTCLDPDWRDYSRTDYRGHVKWLDEFVMPKVCKKEVLTDAEETILCCLIHHLTRLLAIGYPDGVTFSYAACLMTRLACVYVLPPEMIMATIQTKSTEDYSLLAAAAVLRLRMLLRTMPQPTVNENEATLEDLVFQDPRFKAGIEYDTNLCILDMAAFLKAVCAKELVGRTKGEEFYTNVQYGKHGVVALTDKGKSCFLLCSGQRTFFTTGLPKVQWEFHSKAGELVWELIWAGAEMEYLRTVDGIQSFSAEFRFEDGLYTFADKTDNASLREQTITSYKAWESQQLEVQRKNERELEELEKQLAW